MGKALLAIDAESIIKRARAGQSLGEGQTDDGFPDTILLLANAVAGNERRVMRDWRLKRLRALLAHGKSANGAARVVLDYLAAYRIQKWAIDRNSGRCGSLDQCEQLAFEIFALGGPPEKRTLQTLFASQRHR
jgi:hypothetical protein